MSVRVPRLSLTPAHYLIVTLILTRLAVFAGLLVGRGFHLRPFLNAAGHTYDAAWYVQIAQSGYSPSDPRIAAFFPGYPALIRLVSVPFQALASIWLQGKGLATADDQIIFPAIAFALSNLTLIGAIGILWSLYVDRLGPRATAIGLAILLACPSALFLSTGYSESPFLLTIAFSLLCAQRKRWLWAGIWGGAACLIRFQGAFLLVPLAMIWWNSRATARPGDRRLTAIGLTAFGAAAVSYHIFLWAQFGDPATYLHAQRFWSRGNSGPLGAVQALRHSVKEVATWMAAGLPDSQLDPAFREFLELAAVGLAAAVVGAGRRWLRPWEVAWIALVMLIPLATGTTLSLNRFVVVAFPAFMVLGMWFRSHPRLVVLTVGILTVVQFQQTVEFARVVLVG
ncbi:MAG TPA: hypothetical protein VG015_03510 [Candidatus Dormibacteraeota bacterium]|nr:hypothetical protein [Candidatus Dormibacteraeota bacterium]